MDVSKLDKMKVVDLRNELQTRGLDTKGVKAVLVERLRAVYEGGEVPPSTPTGTPAKRSRRTRSMTRSPSPSPKKAVEPELEALPEEGENIADDRHDDDDDDERPESEEQDIEDHDEEDEEEEDEESRPLADVHEEEDKSDEEARERDEEISNQHDENSNVDKEIDHEVVHDSEPEPEEKKETENERDNDKNDDSDAESKPRRKRSHSSTSRRSHSKDRRSSKVRDEHPEDEPTIEDKQFGLSWYDSDLYLRIDPVTFTSAKPMSQDIYSLLWSGVRANYGVRDGKVCYEVRLAEETNMSRSHQFRDEPHVRGFRVGFSLPNTKLILGEDENSFAYCESGRKALNTEFSDYGKSYQLDDVIGCYLDLESTPCTIKYTLNGEDLGVAFEFEKSILGEDGALFPHILTKGYEFHVNFADNENLLVNVERQKRLRRKPRIVESKDKPLKDKDENWEVVDEAKCENDKDEEKPPKAGNDDADVEMKDESNGADKEKSQEVIKDEKKINNEIEADAAISNGSGGEESKSNANNKEDEKETTENEKKSSRRSEGDDDGPSPRKRHRTESHSKHNDHASEDEYEEIIPEPRDPVNLLPGYELIALIPEEKYIAGPQRPESRKNCEVILLVGLPGSGKTHWTEKHISEQLDKRYHVIGVDALIAKMSIDGEPRKPLHKGRWEKVYELCLNSLPPLEEIAMKRRRNFILDQTNSYASVQRRKMKGFGDFKRIAVVCIPNADELKRRNDEKTEKGNAQPIKDSTLNNLRANFTLPSLEFGWFDDVIYTDLNGDEAKDEVKKYNEKGKKALDAMPSNNRDKRNRRDRFQNRNRRYDDRRDFRNDNRWNDRRSGGGGGSGGSGGYRGNSGWRDNGHSNWMQNNRNNRWGGGGNSGGGYHRGGSGWRDGGGSNWTPNRNRYDDRYNSGGSGGSNRDRDRHRQSQGSGHRDNYRSGGGSGRSQRDFRPGHRDNRTEDSRGGYENLTAASSASRYEQYSNHNNGKQASNGNTSKGGKWSSYPAQTHSNQDHQQQQQWQQYQQQQQQVTSQQQQYWGYNDMQQAYGNQQQWPNATDPSQQQQWMSWWQQQGNTQAASSGAGGGEANHYWSQYSYPTSNSGTGADGSSKK